MSEVASKITVRHATEHHEALGERVGELMAGKEPL
jgi:hypothetical protein